MSITIQKRIHGGVPAGGQFASHDRADADIRLVPDTVPSQQDWLDRNGLHLPPLSRAEFEVRLTRLGRPITDLDRADVFRTVHREHLGYDVTDIADARAAAQQLRERGEHHAADAIERLASAAKADQRDEQGASPPDAPLASEATGAPPRQVLSANRAGDGTILFTRPGDGEVPDEPTALRVQVDRSLSDDERAALNDAVRYALNAAHRGAAGEDPWSDTSASTVVEVNLAENRTRSKDSERFALFERRVRHLLEHGSEVRTTDRSGPGTRGTRAIEPWAKPPRFVVFYDRVAGAG
ncbi:MAG: hypothetical protein ACXIUP_00200 [Microcella sp.]